MSRTTPLYVIWQFRQVVDYLLSLDHVTFGAALQQSLRKAGCAPNTLHDLAAPEQLIDSLTHRRNSFAEVADAEALTCRTNLHRWQVDPEVLLLYAQIVDLRQHLCTALAFGASMSRCASTYFTLPTEARIALGHRRATAMTEPGVLDGLGATRSARGLGRHPTLRHSRDSGVHPG